MAAVGIDMFFLGFQECKLKITEAFPSIDVSGIRPPGEEDEDEGQPKDGEEEGVTEIEEAVDRAAETPAQPANPGAEQSKILALPNHPEVPPEPLESAKEDDAIADP